MLDVRSVLVIGRRWNTRVIGIDRNIDGQIKAGRRF
jgi:hypothetical protein